MGHLEVASDFEAVCQARAHHPCVRLVPHSDVTVEGDSYRALSSSPWLRLVPAKPLQAGRVYKITYACGFEEEVVRPVLRCIDEAATFIDIILSAASEGVGVWRGRIPRGTVELLVNPVAQPGPFSFEIESFAPLPLSDRLRRARRSPMRTFFACSAQMVGLEAEAHLNQRWVYGRAEVADYEAWRMRRRASAEQNGALVGCLAVVLLNGAGDSDLLTKTYASLVRQSHRTWLLSIIAPTPSQAKWLAAHHDPRVRGLDEIGQPVGQARFTAILRPGDELADHALGSVSARFARSPSERIIYSDEARVELEKKSPVFKPDWSPIRQAFAPYVGRAAFVRDVPSVSELAAAASPETWIDEALSTAQTNEVGHIRRALVYTREPVTAPIRKPSRTALKLVSGTDPVIGIVVPTRDRFDLLDRCLQSLFAKTSYPDYRVVVVDNGSIQKRTAEGLARLKSEHSRLSVRSAPGRFNFSALCNLGAAELKSDYLVFLNNDTEVVDREWLEKMLEFASRPNVGAVGAKLLYPNRRVQHAGVVLGLGGVAGHFGAGAACTDKGWLDGDLFPHEVSAVTAACLMVERRKFEAIGGFDAENLPVDLNDVDLCLRLAERGWGSVCDCRTELLHRQSASRGGGLRLQKKYESERRYFREKWGALIRDDPYFNPNLSLYDYSPVLG